MQHYNEQFRAKVAAKMNKRGWTEAELARRAGLPYSTLNTLLKATGEIHYSRAMAINDALAGKKRVNNEEGD